jgi:hypothetical protein
MAREPADLEHNSWDAAAAIGSHPEQCGTFQAKVLFRSVVPHNEHSVFKIRRRRALEVGIGVCRVQYLIKKSLIHPAAVHSVTRDQNPIAEQTVAIDAWLRPLEECRQISSSKWPVNTMMFPELTMVLL